MANYEDENIKVTSDKTYHNVEDLLADFNTMAVHPVVDVPTADDFVSDESLMMAAVEDSLGEVPLSKTSEEKTEESGESETSEESVIPENEPIAEEKPKEKKQKKEKNKKDKKRKRHKKKHPLISFLIFLLVLFGLYEFAQSDFFTVTSIEVEGNKHYTVAQIVDMSAIKTGHNLFKTDTSAGKETLLQDPYIRLVSIKKVPRGTIRIIVEEREEYAAVPYGDDYILIDKTGMVLRVTDKEPALPLLVGMTIIEMTPGNPLSVEQAYLLVNTLELLGVMEENDLYFKRVNFSTVVVKAFIYDDLYCEGTPVNITNNMPAIKKLVSNLYSEGTTRGIIKVGKDEYLSFDPQIE